MFTHHGCDSNLTATYRALMYVGYIFSIACLNFGHILEINHSNFYFSIISSYNHLWVALNLLSYSWTISLGPMIISHILLTLSNPTYGKWYSASKVALISSHVFIIFPWVLFLLNFINHCNTTSHNVVVNLMINVPSFVTYHRVQSFSSINKCFFASLVSF